MGRPKLTLSNIEVAIAGWTNGREQTWVDGSVVEFCWAKKFGCRVFLSTGVTG